MISPEVYRKVDQQKFIPIIAERDAEGGLCLPAYLASRLYIDLSQEATFEAEYQKLLRDIYGRPEHTRPPLGEPPAFLFDEATTKAAAVPIGQTVPFILGGPDASAAFIEGFFRPFLRELGEYRFTPVEDEQYDETMMKLIEDMKPLKDSFVQFADRLGRQSLTVDDLDHIHDNLERLAQLQYPVLTSRYYRETDWDNYRFICYELVLYLVALLVRYGRFGEVAKLIDSTYFYERMTDRNSYTGIAVFNSNYIRSLEELRKRRLQLNRVSLTADLIKERAEDGLLEFDSLIEADLLLHYLTLLREPLDPPLWQPEVWFPRLSPFAEHLRGIPVLTKLVSRRHFERAKVLFGVNDPDELKILIDGSVAREATYRQGVDTFHYTIPPLESVIPTERLASVS